MTTETQDMIPGMPSNAETLKQLQEQHRLILAENREREKQRKARKRRLYDHGAIVEELFPETAAMDNGAFAEFLQTHFQG